MCDKSKYEDLVAKVGSLERTIKSAHNEASKARGEIASLRFDTNVSLKEFGESVKGLVDIMDTVAGFLRTLGWLGSAVKWLGLMGASAAAVYMTVEAFIKVKLGG